MMNKREWSRMCWGATLIGGVLMWTTACLPPGFLAGLDFGAFEMFSHSSCSDLESSLKQRALKEARFRDGASFGSTAYDPAGYAGIGARDLSDKSSSTTNNQEEGVDEADIFKVDGKYAYALHGSALVIVESGSQPRQISWTQIEGAPFDMFIHGDRALVMLRTNHDEVKTHFQTGDDIPDRPADFKVVKAALYDISDRAKPGLIRELFVEGEYLSSRRVGERAYIVTQSMLGGPATEVPEGDANWLSRRTKAINSAKLSDWIPHYYDVNYTDDGEVANADSNNCSCNDTWESPSGTGDDALAIYSISLDNGDSDVETAAIIGDGATVYGSQKGMVVAMTNYAEKTYGDDNTGFSVGTENRTGQVTHLHRFSLSETGKVNYEASGQVDGWILNQFSLSEYKNVLRVGTMIGQLGDPDVETAVFTLRLKSKDDGLFSTSSKKSSYLKVIGEVRGIGYGEDLYAVRFKEDIGYVVTFLETDPLWTIDVSKPESPKILGELMVPGYSTYLHPIDGGKLLGVGRADWLDDEGIKLSLFDVSDLRNPDVVEEVAVGDFNSSTEVTNTHKAFHWIADRSIMAIPMIHSDYSGLLLYKVDNSGLRFLTSIKHNSMIDTSGSSFPAVLRSQRIGDDLYSYSRSGIAVTDLNNLDRTINVDLDDM